MSFFRKRVQPAIQIKMVSREPFKLILSEWRADRNMTRAAQKMLLDPVVKLAVQVLRNSSPSLEVMQFGTSIEDRAMQQCRIEGYMLALNNLEAMGVHELPAQPIEATFEEEEIQITKV